MNHAIPRFWAHCPSKRSFHFHPSSPLRGQYHCRTSRQLPPEKWWEAVFEDQISKYQPCSTWIQPVFSHILCMMMHLLPALRVAGPFQQYDMAPGATWTWHDLAISNPNSSAVQQPTEIPTPSTPMTCGVWSASKAPEQFWATGDGRRILETTVGVKWPHSQRWHKLD